MTSKTFFALALLALGGFAASACSSEPVVVSVHCTLDYAPAKPCKMTDRVNADGTHDMTFVSGKTRTRFVGKSQSGWWSGQLNGRPAMGYERNRGHVVFSTTDLKTTFAWWSEGNEHGAY
jgi:hypothetical protein